MKALDLIIIFGYLIGIVVFGTWFGSKQKTTKDYFLGDRSVPWWAVAFSIVATETSTITFVSVPGIAFSRGGNFQFGWKNHPHRWRQKRRHHPKSGCFNLARTQATTQGTQVKDQAARVCLCKSSCKSGTRPVAAG